MSTQDPLETKNNIGSSLQPQPVTTGADLILHYLEQIGVEYVFGIPGGGIEPLYNALARSQRRGGPRAIVARHETGAAFMADGYARESGKLGVCCATTGPGATNMITGVASAYMDHIPLLAITAQTSLKTFGKGAFQESSCTGIDIVAMYEHCTRYNTLVSHIDQLEEKLINAINTAMHPPFGTAHLSIPIDILRAPVNDYLSAELGELIKPSNAVDDEAVDQIFRSLYGARNIVFLVGANARNGISSILELAIIVNAHVLTTPHSKGLINSFHPQYRGVFGISGHTTAHSLLDNKTTDVVFIIGSNLDEFSTNAWDLTQQLGDKTYFIDYSPLYFSRTPKARRHISSNINRLFERLLTRFRNLHNAEHDNVPRRISKEIWHETPVIPFERRANSRRRDNSNSSFKSISYLPTRDRRQDMDRRSGQGKPSLVRRFTLQDEDKYLSNAIPIKPQRLMYDLSRLFPPNTRFIVDIGNSMYWAIHYLHPFSRRFIGDRTPTAGTVRLGLGFASMGWAIGASIGTALASPKSPLVCITGDGSVLMSSHELTSAVQEKLNIIFIILNDSSLGAVKHGQLLAGAESIGWELARIDYAAYAKAIGASSYIIRSPQDMNELDVKAICKHAGPTVLDVRIDPNEVPPLEARVKVITADKHPA